MNTTSWPAGRRAARRWSSLLVLLLLAATAAPVRAERPRVYAITGARIVVSPGTEIPSGTVVLRDGLIEAAGKDTEAPADAYVIDAAGRTVTAGFIDACSDLGLRRPEGGATGQAAGGSGGQAAARTPAPETPPGTLHPISRVRPERRAVDQLVTDATTFDKHRAMGFTTAMSLPAEGIFRGQPVVFNLGSGAPPTNVLRESAGHVIAFESGSFGQGYPSSLMGAIAAIRQTLLDARRDAIWRERYASDPAGMKRPDTLAAHGALAGAAAGKERVYFDAAESANVERALAISREFSLDAVLIASGLENTQNGLIPLVSAARRPLIVPLAYPEKPKVSDPDEALQVTTSELERWDAAPANPAALQDAGIPFSLGTCRAPSAAEFPARLRKAMDRGLSAQTALAALTTEPARLLGMERSIGSIEAGKIANVVVWDGAPAGERGIFDEKAKPVQVFVDGVKFEIEQKKSRGDPNARVDPRGTWSISLTIGGRAVNRTWTITGSPGDYAGTAETQRGVVSFTSVKLAGNEMTVVMPADGNRPGSDITVVITGEEMEGSGEFSSGMSYTVKGTRTSGPEGGLL